MDKNQPQITKDQHYVPQFYLKKFINEVGKLEILDCEHRKIVQSRTPKSVCYEEYFYSANNELDEASQEIEKEFERIETKISDAYGGIVERFINFKEITLDDKILISTFMSMQYLRGPYMRKQIKRMSESVIKQITQMRYGSDDINHSLDKFEIQTGEKISAQERKDLIKLARSGNYNVETNNVTHLQMFAEMEGFRNLFFAKDWLVYVSKSNKKFITSDSPIIEIFPEWTSKFFYGPSFLQRIHQFAMTPEIFIVANDHKNSSGIGKIKRKTLFDNEKHNNKILELNFEYPRNAIAYAYANNKNSLNDILNVVDLYDKKQEEKLNQIIQSVIRR